VKLRDCPLFQFVAVVEESAEVSRLKSYAIQKGRGARIRGKDSCKASLSASRGFEDSPRQKLQRCIKISCVIFDVNRQGLSDCQLTGLGG